MSESAQGQQGLVIASILPTLAPMPQVLQDAENRAARGLTAASSLIDKCAAAGKMSGELDTECQEMIVKIKKTIDLMTENRKPYTQLMEEIRAAFTGEENRLKPMLEQLQRFRDQRAREVAEENRRREQEAARLAAKNKEAADIRATFVKAIGTDLNNKLFSRKQELQQLFDGLTLADIDERGQKLEGLINTFPVGKLDQILTVATVRAAYHSNEEIEVLRLEMKDSFDWDGFYARYQQELDIVKIGLVNRLPNKKAELQEAERIRKEKERIAQEQEAARQRQAEIDRQAREAKTAAEQKRVAEQQAAEAERQRQLDEQRKLQEAEAEKMRQQEAERKRIEDEKRESERIEAEKTAAAAAEQARIQSHSNTLFDQVNAGNQKEAEPEMRKGWEITVKEAAGWAEIFQFWFLNGMADAWSKDSEKVGDIDLNKMKAFAEKKADKEKIVSPLLEYKETFKAVNRAKKVTSAK